MLKKLGWDTHAVGKWHIGSYDVRFRWAPLLPIQMSLSVGIETYRESGGIPPPSRPTRRLLRSGTWSRPLVGLTRTMVT